jgi:hypothetical protein
MSQCILIGVGDHVSVIGKVLSASGIDTHTVRGSRPMSELVAVCPLGEEVKVAILFCQGLETSGLDHLEALRRASPGLSLHAICTEDIALPASAFTAKGANMVSVVATYTAYRIAPLIRKAWFEEVRSGGQAREINRRTHAQVTHVKRPPPPTLGAIEQLWTCAKIKHVELTSEDLVPAN